MGASKSAIITGITGQDGSYLAELLLDSDYDVHGIVRRSSMFNRDRIEHLRRKRKPGGGQLFLHYSDLEDATSMRRILAKVRPAEIYHLAGQSHVGLSFEIPESTCREVAMATVSLLEIIRDMSEEVRVYYASSSEIFGLPEISPQTESTPYNPRNPYACAKAFSTQLCRVYREAYNIFVCSGITYNHESPRRGENFVTRKITQGAAKVRAGLASCIELGNLDASRDWGFAKEYVEAMHRMLNAEQPGDYVLATGVECSVRDFTIAAFAALDIPVEFAGAGVDEIGHRTDTGAVVVRVNPVYFRPTESGSLVGDSSKAKRLLGWSPTISGKDVARLMALADWQHLSEAADGRQPA